MKNASFFTGTIESFFEKEYLKYKGEKIFAICNYVPAFDQFKLISKNIQNHYIFYP